MKSVLIIDDEADLLEILRHIMRHFNLNTLTSTKALSIDEILELNPDIVLLDHNLSGRSGGQMCAAMKSDPRSRHIPVVMVSADEALPRIAEQAGADGYIKKPFDITDLQGAITGLLRESGDQRDRASGKQ